MHLSWKCDSVENIYLVFMGLAHSHFIIISHHVPPCQLNHHLSKSQSTPVNDKITSKKTWLLISYSFSLGTSEGWICTLWQWRIILVFCLLQPAWQCPPITNTNLKNRHGFIAEIALRISNRYNVHMTRAITSNQNGF